MMPRRSYAAAAGSISTTPWSTPTPWTVTPGRLSRSTARRDVPIRCAALASLVAQTGEAVFADKPIATDRDVAIERYFARPPHDSHFLASTTISHPLTTWWRCDASPAGSTSTEARGFGRQRRGRAAP